MYVGREDTPALITVEEVLADNELLELNKAAQKRIQEARKALLDANGNLNFVKLPVLYAGIRTLVGQAIWDNPTQLRPYFRFEASRTAVAYTPNPVNFQVVDGKPYLPDPFGPRDENNKDVFRLAIESSLPTGLFLDDWADYHRHEGEVHCGTTVVRDPSVKKPGWWARQP